MKKLLFGFLALSLVSFCNAQIADKKDKVKFTKPVIKKDKTASTTASTVKFSPPVIKKNKTVKKSEKTHFTPPVIVKDKSTM